ncbi:MAG: hypothetical protein ACJA2S_001249 [Cyclobacteriaceae bacterium]|jgi:hypothetical protein
MKYFGIALLLVLISISQSFSQDQYWQQRVEYKININMDVETNQFEGRQALRYYNNSPDTLTKVFYHLYFNAFQPGSSMDVRSRTIVDPDKRVESRIYKLKEEEQGWHKISSLTQDGKSLDYEVSGTLLEVTLAEPILPGTVSMFYMDFESQVPLQIRRSGRDSKEGIRYSMSQWYPKMAEYDHTGWHAHPYVAREFYGPWGNFDVTIVMDKKYVIGATGILQNPQEIGYGYDKPKSKGKSGVDGKLIWKFFAENVGDFVWAADPDYKHDIAVSTTNGPDVHYFYQKDTAAKNWKVLPTYLDKAFKSLNEKFSAYPYDHYSVIQGGDGGMEYPMATLITGNRKLESLVGVSVHEMAHSWLPLLAGTNESYMAWLDEGFASYSSGLVMAELFPKRKKKLFQSSYKSYISLVNTGKQEPLSTHADHFNTNRSYGISSYTKGSIMFHQLGYVIGEDVMFKALRNYFDKWKFKHAGKEEFIREFEKESGLVLDWYFDYWISTTKTIDYGIRSVNSEDRKTNLLLEKIGEMPMPIEIMVQLKDSTNKRYYIPIEMMRGEKQHPEEVKTMSDWPWVNPFYELSIPHALSEIESIEIDDSQRMADVDRSNNLFPFNKNLELKGVEK